MKSKKSKNQKPRPKKSPELSISQKLSSFLRKIKILEARVQFLEDENAKIKKNIENNE
jgi:hypothetical protein